MLLLHIKTHYTAVRDCFFQSGNFWPENAFSQFKQDSGGCATHYIFIAAPTAAENSLTTVGFGRTDNTTGTQKQPSKFNDRESKYNFGKYKKWEHTNKKVTKSKTTKGGWL